MNATGSDEEYPEARRENGAFKLPWEGNLHGVFGAMKWFLTSPNNSKVPRQSEVMFFLIAFKAMVVSKIFYIFYRHMFVMIRCEKKRSELM